MYALKNVFNKFASERRGIAATPAEDNPRDPVEATLSFCAQARCATFPSKKPCKWTRPGACMLLIGSQCSAGQTQISKESQQQFCHEHRADRCSAHKTNIKRNQFHSGEKFVEENRHRTCRQDLENIHNSFRFNDTRDHRADLGLTLLVSHFQIILVEMLLCQRSDDGACASELKRQSLLSVAERNKEGRG